MKNAILAGAIAGLVSGIVSSLLVFVGLSIGILGANIIVSVSQLQKTNSAIYIILLTVIFGTLVALIYSKFYDSIPGKGLKKGLYFGLMIWFVKDIMAAAYITIPMMQPAIIGVNLIVVGFYVWVIYGLVLGYLYKKE
jgi:uncharacterized membrane protein YadS